MKLADRIIQFEKWKQFRLHVEMEVSRLCCFWLRDPVDLQYLPFKCLELYRYTKLLVLWFLYLKFVIGTACLSIKIFIRCSNRVPLNLFMLRFVYKDSTSQREAIHNKLKR